MEELKFLQVFESTHIQAKKQAKENSMSIRAYIQHLLDKDKKC